MLTQCTKGMDRTIPRLCVCVFSGKDLSPEIIIIYCNMPGLKNAKLINA